MRGGGKPRLLTERQGKWLLNLFPPLLFNRVRTVKFGPGFRHCTVRVARSLLTRNLNGTTFGGTIFCAADPFYAIMYWQVFARRGEHVQAWLRRARIDYLKPAETPLTLEFSLSDEDIELAATSLECEGRFTRNHEARAVDAAGQVCALIETEIYLRRTIQDQKEISAF